MVHITVTVGQEQLAGISDVAERLRSEGMEVDRVLASIGVITGTVADDRRKALEAVDGVESVDDERTFQLPAPDSDIQ